MENYRESLFKEICLDEGTIANIFVSDNNIYVIGTMSIDDPRVEEEIEIIKQEMFEKGNDLINVVYSGSLDYYNIVKKDSPAEAFINEQFSANLEL